MKPTKKNIDQKRVSKKIGFDLIMFFIDYDEFIYAENSKLKVSEIKNVDKLLLAGIAKPEPFFAYLQSKNDEKLVCPDYHYFTKKAILKIKNKSQNKIIITTEKDF